LYRLSERQIQLKKWIPVLLLIIGSVWGVLLTAIPLVGIFKDKLLPLIKDPFAVANLQANVSWNIAESLIGLIYLIGIWVSVFLLKSNFKKGITLLCLLQVVMIQITMLHFTPKIEAYSQRAALEFYESKKGQDVYIQVLGFRSYAYLFYAQKNVASRPEYYNQNWLLGGNVDKPVFLVTKIQDADQYRKMPKLKVLYEKNGFVFFQRLP
jgi:hypothetical protein